jgi:hypothetical protein
VSTGDAVFRQIQSLAFHGGEEWECGADTIDVQEIRAQADSPGLRVRVAA